MANEVARKGEDVLCSPGALGILIARMQSSVWDDTDNIYRVWPALRRRVARWKAEVDAGHERRYGHEAFARHAWMISGDYGRYSLSLALRWERWLFGPDDWTPDRLSFYRSLPPKNYLVAEMVEGRPALKARLGEWIRRVKASARPEDLERARRAARDEEMSW